VATTDINRREFLRRSVLAGVGATFASSVLGSVLPTTARAQTVGSCLFGAHSVPRGTQITQKDATLALEALMGRQVGVFRRYSYWDEPPPDGTHLWAAQTGRIPYISWHAYTRKKVFIPWASIANGDQDTQLKNVASAIAAFGHPVYFSFHHEPENDVKNGTSADFKAAFERVRMAFDKFGATNVTWLVALMASTYKGGHGGADAWLPDPGSYSYVGVDGYNRWPLVKVPGWRSFETIFGPAHDKAVQLAKPLFVAEYGSIEQTCSYPDGDPNAKAAWFTAAAQTVQTWNNVVAIAYSNCDATFNKLLMPYWIDSSAGSVAAFASVGQLPYFA
jgi:hypothetical protein